MEKITVGIIFFIGIISLISSILDLDWVFQGKIIFFIEIFGREITRWIMIILSLAIIILSVLFFLDIIKIS
ncbi:MAG: hypothetical protein KGV57_01760 [Fusobacterium sp.]|nr:hypothetical protein [Fusobacterium sp.]